MFLILGLSSLPAQSIPKTWLLNWDKLIHLIEYFILGILAMKSFKKISFNSVLIVITFGLVFGSIDEFLQSFQVDWMCSPIQLEQLLEHCLYLEIINND